MNDPTPRVPNLEDQATLLPLANPESATLPPLAPDSSATLAPGDSRTPSADARAPAGYVIEKELGRGGMGVVYLARAVALDRPCALMMILSGVHSGAEEIERFRTEASATACPDPGRFAQAPAVRRRSAATGSGTTRAALSRINSWILGTVT